MEAVVAWITLSDGNALDAGLGEASYNEVMRIEKKKGKLK